MATMTEIDAVFSSYRNLYFQLLSRGAAREFPTEMSMVRSRLNSVENAWPELMGTPGRLYDVVTHTGTRVMPILKRIEKKYPEGTLVIPGSTGEENMVPESRLPTLKTDELLEEAPVNIGEKKGAEVAAQAVDGTSWFAPGGVDLRVVGGVAVGFLALSWLMRRR